MRWLTVLAVLLLSGCSSDVATLWEQPGIKARWEAQNVFPQNYKGDLLAFLRTYLNDPNHVREGAISPPQLKSVGAGDRYVACVRYNARESGQYSGVRDGAAIYVSGKLDQFLDGGKHLESSKRVKGLCKDVAYAPFPELERLTR